MFFGIRLYCNAAARKFCRSVKQQKKKGSACVSGVLPVQVVRRGLFVQPFKHFFACSKIDNNLVIVDLFDRCPRIERRRTSQQWTTRQGTMCMFIGSFRQIGERKERPKRVPWTTQTTSWCLLVLCHCFKTWPELVKSVNENERTRGPWACHGHGTVLVLESTMAGCRWKKNLMNEIERRKLTVLSWY